MASLRISASIVCWRSAFMRDAELPPRLPRRSAAPPTAGNPTVSSTANNAVGLESDAPERRNPRSINAATNSSTPPPIFRPTSPHREVFASRAKFTAFAEVAQSFPAGASLLMTNYEHLAVETSADGVRTIILARPERVNAVNEALAFALGDALADAGADDAVRVVVITGAGRAFCAGLDIAEPPVLPSATRADRLDPYAWVGTWVQRVVECEKPVIAAINGAAAGAGFGLALACDIRLVSSSAKLTAGYVRRGLSPDAGVSYFLPRHVGLARAMDILLSGRDVDSTEALLIGLATMVIPDHEFAATVAKYAERLSFGPPIAQALTKRLLIQGMDRPLDATLRDELAQIKVCFATRDVAEAMQAFREKRMPVFEGR